MLPVLYLDALVLVVDKPAGLPSHAGPRGGASVEDALAQMAFGYKEIPQLAHRLDADTAGCLVVGRNERARRKLGRLFEAGAVEKVYWAVVEGSPSGEFGTVDAPLLKVTGKTGWRMTVDPKGQPARTEWRVLGRGNGLAWLECRPKTGRTHQIRIHCAHLGLPLLGDPIYGRGQGPMQLLAHAVSLPPLVDGGAPISVTAPVPAHMQGPLAACGWRP